VLFDDLEAAEKIEVYDKGIALSNGDRLEDLASAPGELSHRRHVVPKVDSTEAVQVAARHSVD